MLAFLTLSPLQWTVHLVCLSTLLQFSESKWMLQDLAALSGQSKLWWTVMTWAGIFFSVAGLLTGQPVWTLGVLICFLLFQFSWGVLYNGGSDAMTFVVLISTSLVALAGPSMTSFALVFVGVQSFLSYFVAGLVKIRNPDWRSGAVLRWLLQESAYPVAPALKNLSKNPTLLKLASWVLIAFELSVIFIFVSPVWAILFIGMGLGFHFFNAYALGLNRFFFAWLATYPALLSLAKILK